MGVALQRCQQPAKQPNQQATEREDEVEQSFSELLVPGGAHMQAPWKGIIGAIAS